MDYADDATDVVCRGHLGYIPGFKEEAFAMCKFTAVETAVPFYALHKPHAPTVGNLGVHLRWPL